jgi:hypothetical protein
MITISLYAAQTQASEHIIAGYTDTSKANKRRSICKTFSEFMPKEAIPFADHDVATGFIVVTVQQG